MREKKTVCVFVCVMRERERERQVSSANFAIDDLLIARRVASWERWRRPWLVANRATLPQKWPPPPGMDRNVADLYELSGMTKPTKFFILRSRVVNAHGCKGGGESGASSSLSAI